MSEDFVSWNEMKKYFVIRDEPELLRKMKLIRAGRAENIHCVLDFDHTLTAGKKPGQNLGTWDVIDEFLPEEGRRRHDEIYLSHRPRELAGQLTDAEAAAWWAETLDLICSYSPDIYRAEKSFLDVTRLREGAKELFDICDQFAIPTVILSAGVRQITEILVKHYGVEPALILSTDLILDAQGKAVGWDKASLIHMLNKREMGHSELSELRRRRPHVVLIGDVPDDARMVDGENVLRVRVVDPRKGEQYNEAEVTRTSFDANFDIIVRDSLQPVAELLKMVLTP